MRSLDYSIPSRGELVPNGLKVALHGRGGGAVQDIVRAELENDVRWTDRSKSGHTQGGRGEPLRKRVAGCREGGLAEIVAHQTLQIPAIAWIRQRREVFAGAERARRTDNGDVRWTGLNACS